MAREIRDYAGGAVDTTLTAGINSTDLSIQIDDATGWPTGGANGPFFIVASYDVAGKEKIEVASRTGTTLTVASTGKRGVDGTSAATHSAGAAVRHCITAQDHDEFNSHAFDTTQDDHTQYLNNTRHDTTGRHTVGSVVPAGTPGAIAPDDTASAGAANSVARSDHRHAITAAAAGTIQPDDTAAEGVATSFARSDHQHAIGAASPSNVGTANAEGAGTSFARSDHVHNLGPGAVNLATKILDEIIPFSKLTQAATTFSPAWTNVTLGTAGAQWGHYFKLGRLVVGMTGFLLGTSGANVTGTLAFTCPTAVADLTGGIYAGQNAGGFVAARASEAGVANWAAIGRLQSDAQAGFFSTTGSAAIWGAGGVGPFDWEENDHLEAIFIYVAPS